MYALCPMLRGLPLAKAHLRQSYKKEWQPVLPRCPGNELATLGALNSRPERTELREFLAGPPRATDWAPVHFSGRKCF